MLSVRNTQDSNALQNFYDVDRALEGLKGSSAQATTLLTPTVGQLWYDTTADALKYFNNSLTATTIGTGSGSGTVTSLTEGAGINLTPDTITSTGSIGIDSTVATLTGTQTLTGKTIALGSNTVSGTTAQFNTALTDGDFATLAGTETLTNKSIDGDTNTVQDLGPTTLKTTALYQDFLQRSDGSVTNTTTTAALVTGLSSTTTFPATSRKLKVTAWATVLHSANGGAVIVELWRGSVGSGTVVATCTHHSSNANDQGSVFLGAVESPSAGSITYELSLKRGSVAGTATISGGSTANGAQLLLEII